MSAVISDKVCARFFFARVQSAFWVKTVVAAIESGQLDEEAVWLRLNYLLRICSASPQVLLATLPLVRGRLTARMLYDVLKALLEQPPEVAWSLRALVNDYIFQPSHIISTDLGAYLLKVSSAQNLNSDEFLEMVCSALAFQRDPKWQEDAKEDQWGEAHEPVPRFDSWEYQQILETGVRGLVKWNPGGVAHALLAVVRDLLRLKATKEVRRNGVRQDLSAIWCSRISGIKGERADPDEALVHTFTYSCETVFSRAAEDWDGVERLDTALRKERWELLDRIRFHCYSKFPKESAKWIAIEVLEYPDYRNGIHGYEFAEMVRRASEVLGERFIASDAQARIFDAIVQGPTDEELRERFGERSSPERFQKFRQSHLAKNLWPFEPLLSGRLLEAYRNARGQNDPVSPEDFKAFSSGPVRTVESRSPVANERLAEMSDEALIQYLNLWEERTDRESTEWWIEENFEGLANAFRQLVQNQPDRFANFKEKWQEIRRPIYFRYAIDAAQSEIKSGNLMRLGAWLHLCEWVADHEDPRGEVRKDLSETSATTPTWEPTRRAVVDFATVCLEGSSNVPLVWRREIGDLLRKLITGYDSRLENRISVFSSSDPLTDAINTTRGRAIEAIAQFALWVRRANREDRADDSMHEIREVLERRFHGQPALLPPEYAQLGRLFPLFLQLDRDWTANITNHIFPEMGCAAWQSAFGTFVLFNQPNGAYVGLLRNHYEYATVHPEIWPSEGRSRRDFFPRLGQHLFSYYIWGLTPLNGPGSLLEGFYASTKPEIWASLMQHVGQALKNTPNLEAGLKTKCMEFFAARLAVGDPTELTEFAFWLAADSLDLTWRLRNFIATLKLTGNQDFAASLVVGDLKRLLDQDVDLVVEAFAEMVNVGLLRSGFYINKDEVVPILKAGLASNNTNTRSYAVSAQEGLLKAGLFEFLEL